MLPFAYRVNVSAAFPTQVVGKEGVEVSKANGVYSIGSAYEVLAPLGALPTPSQKFMKVYDNITGIYNTVPLSLLSSGSSGAGSREVLTTNRIYYVSTLGSDGNDGLTSGTPFGTIAHAWNTVITKLDLGGHAVTIQLAAGQTFTGGASLQGLWLGGGLVIFDGSGSTVSNSAGNALAISTGSPSEIVYVKNMTLTTTGGGGACLTVNSGIVHMQGGMVFGPCAGIQIVVANGGWITAENNYTINGSAAQSHVYADALSAIDFYLPITVTLTGTPSFGAFAVATLGGLVYWPGGTFSGSATGQKYSASLNAVMVTGAGVNYFPGNVAGTALSGSQYA